MATIIKRFFFNIVFVFLTITVFGQTSDVTKLGYKGEILSAKVADYGTWNTFRFGPNGAIYPEFIDYCEVKGEYYTATITKRTKNGFSGTSPYGTFTLTLSGNHVSSISFKDGDKTLTRTFTYDKAGNLEKINETYIYYTTENIEYGANLTGVDDYYNEINRAANDYYNEIEKAANDYYNDLMRNPYNYNSAANRATNRINRNANKAANRINKAAGRVGVNSYSRVKKTKHIEKASATFRNYEYDDFGNWTSRTYVKESGNSYTQQQIIEYEPEFWSREMWERVKATGDLRKIEAFALNPQCTTTFRNIAANYWNDNILGEVSRVDKNHPDSLLHVASSKIINSDNKEVAMNLARQGIFDNEVMPIRDFVKVKETKSINRFGIDVFDREYQVKIDERSDQLRADSIQFLTKKSQRFFDSQKYDDAFSTAFSIYEIDANNTFAEDMLQESSYQIIIKNEELKIVKEEDYNIFLDTFDDSPHFQEVCDKRALYASSLFNRSTSNSELERVYGLPTFDKKARKTVKKRYKRWMFRNNRGHFFHIGFEGEASFGKVNTLAAAGLVVSLGYTCNVFNLVTGFKYNRLMSTRHMFEKPKEPGQAYFERQYFSVPVMLRLNILNGYLGNTYLGAGAELNVVDLKSRLYGLDEIEDDKFAHQGFSFSPRVALGGRLANFEIELFATYDVDNPFNVDYIKGYRVNEDQSIETLCDPKSYDEQIKADGFMDKVRGGLAIRLVF